MKSKLSDISCLIKNKKIRPHVPSTRPFTQSWLKEMLVQHPIVYVKPDSSLKGIGVIRIDNTHDHYILRVQDTQKSTTHTSLSSVWSRLNIVKRKQAYIIQQGIQSLTTTENPFDVRIHLLRVSGIWHVGGMIGKVGEKKSIVTNGSAGASSIQINQLLKSYLGLSPDEATELKKQMKAVSINVVKAMRIKHPNWCEYGLDIGIDSNRHVWIYEVNTLPGAIGFKETDRSSYLRICSLRKRAS